MNHKFLKYEELNILSTDIYEQMGYGSSAPNEDVVAEVNKIVDETKGFLLPQFCYFVINGVYDMNTLNVDDTLFNIGRIIARQLRGSEAYAFFVCTAGMEFEHYQHRLMSEGDMVRVFIADALGSVIAEKCADQMEAHLQASIDKLGWKHTNRFSPGYCGWHVREQQKLFPLFGARGEACPCGVTLTESSLMLPIKSVSGVIGLGKNVRKRDYTCGLCDYQKCYKRKNLRFIRNLE